MACSTKPSVAYLSGMFLILFCGLKLIVACVRLPPCVSTCTVLQAGILLSARRSVHMRRRQAPDLNIVLAGTIAQSCTLASTPEV